MSNFEFNRKWQELKVPKRSGFDKSFKNLLTSKVGTITPILCDEVIPNTRVHLSTAINACLPPLATETFMNCNLKVEAFFVPMRQLYGGFEYWLTGEKAYNGQGTAVNVGIPRLYIQTSESAYLQPGKLSDYLGYKMTSADVAAYGSATSWNIFPLLAYHWIYDNWYRNSLVQNPAFTRPMQSVASQGISTLPWKFTSNTTETNFSLSNQFNDGVHLGDLRQRNFDIDYFTSAQPSAQRGSDSSVSMSITVPSGGGTVSTSFTIAALRAANSLQQFAERNNYSLKLVDYVKANYGATLSDGMAQRPLFLGQQTISVYTKGVEQTTDVTGAATNNPFTTTGAVYGKAVCVGSGTLIDDFVAQEPGYIFVNATLVPKVNYGTGILRQNVHYNQNASQTDMANAALQNTGQQPIYQYELSSSQAANTNVFGYTDRYAEYMTREDEVHGEVRDGQSLDAFCTQRSFASTVVQGDSFLKIPTNYLDQVTAVNSTVSTFGCWIDCYFNYKVSMPLAQYSIPSLQDPAYEHGETVHVKKGGASVY